MTPRLDTMLDLCKRATKGFWFFNREYGLHVLTIPKAEPHIIASEVKIDDGKFIQSCDPQTIEAMIGLLKEARVIAERLNECTASSNYQGHGNRLAMAFIDKFDEFNKEVAG